VRLQNGDVIHIPPSGHSIRLEGRVHRPAIYELKADEGLKRLLEIAGGLEPDAYAERIQIERIVENRERQIVDIDLAELHTADQDYSLCDGDVVSVFAIPETYGNAVTVEGFVGRPGRYQLLPGMTVSQLVDRCDGILPEAYMGRSDLVRTNPDLTRDLVSFHLGKALADSVNHNLLLQPRDSITIYSIHTFGEERFVTIDGLVRKPGRYELLDGMRLKDLIAMAGGLRDVAYKLEAEVARSDPEDARADQPIQVHRAAIRDAYEADPGEINGFLLRNRDAVFIRENPDYEPQQYVTLQGRLRFPGVYALKSSSERLTDILERAGGLEDDAYPEGIRFRRRALGTVAVDLRAALEERGSSDDLVLLDGDQIEIPQCPHTVEVVGAVRRPTCVVYRPGKGVGYYLERAGGLVAGTSSGDVYIVRANGEALKSRRFLLWRRWPAVNPGSRIVVPPADDRARAESEVVQAREPRLP
ncbi:MAG: SLBB domain-containing protein, partial [Candidatus Latescibacteria bacterium]|nr:SLBB domain-containing protein [Candidatus Latescibacterota bacterium]